MTTYLLTYLIKSVLSLLVLLGVYALLLENQPMHRLKRTYLLGTLLLSLAIPFVSLPMSAGWFSGVDPVQFVDNQVYNFVEEGKSLVDSPSATGQKVNIPAPGNVPAANVPDSTLYWFWFYAAGTLLMLTRFARNLFVLLRQVWATPTEPYCGATLVKMPGNGLPYTFLNYLFIPAAIYDRGEIENELFTHELTHIRQHHSLDVLLIELVLCVGWFNPLLFWLKEAMQRNHEFLADQAVNDTYLNVPGYQHLLLSKLAFNSPKRSLTSTLTFQTTKQRLTMMTKQTTAACTCVAGCGTALLFTLLTIVLTGTAPAQQMPARQTPQKVAFQLEPTEVAELERLYGEKMVHLPTRTNSPSKRREKKFKDLTPEEKTRVLVLKPRARKTPTEAEWEDFKNTKKYGVWVDGKRRRDNPMATYNRTDVVSYSYSYVYKNARQPEGYLYQLDLETEQGYKLTIRDWELSPWLTLISKEWMDKRRAKPDR